MPHIAIIKPRIVSAGRLPRHWSNLKPPIIGTSTTIASCQLIFSAAIKKSLPGVSEPCARAVCVCLFSAITLIDSNTNYRCRQSRKVCYNRNMNQVTVYGAEWCGFCHSMRQYLDKKKIAFDYKDIEQD